MPEPAALVCVHGAGGGGWEWRIWARVAAAAGHPVLAPDLQPAAAGLAATRFDDYRRQVRGWIDAAGGDGRRVVAIGASLGGLLVAAAGGKVAARVLVNPLPPRGIAARPAPPATPDGLRAWGRSASLAGTRAALPDADPFTALAVWRRWRDESAAVLADAYAGIDVEPPAVPCLVIASDADDDVPVPASAALAAAWGAQLRHVGGSHVGPLLGRDAARIAADAIAWLNGAVPDG